jgi:carbon storage regulator
MLVLNRLEGESIRIGNDIVIKILETGNRVMLGITAPKHVRVDRSEIAALRNENCVLPLVHNNKDDIVS